MKIVKIEESGVNGALLGIGLSYGKTCDFTNYILSPSYSKDWTPTDTLPEKIGDAIIARMENRASKLALKNGGHSEFLRHSFLQFLIEAPDFWWKHMKEYTFVYDLSTSQMHTILNEDLTQDNFEYYIPEVYLEQLSRDRKDVQLGNLKFEEYVNRIPVGYLYTRVISTNYMALQNICNQRKNHKLPQWKMFIDAVMEQIEHPEWIMKGSNE